MDKLNRVPKAVTSLRQVGHGDGEDIRVYVWQGVEEPRIKRVDTYNTRKRTTKSEWHADGGPAMEPEEIDKVLEHPPKITFDDANLLNQVPYEWRDMRGTTDIRMLTRLSDRGLIEWSKGRVRRIKDRPHTVDLEPWTPTAGSA